MSSTNKILKNAQDNRTNSVDYVVSATSKSILRLKYYSVENSKTNIGDQGGGGGLPVLGLNVQNIFQ
jgi:hypothetical protein